jgi:hypothetical protein
MCHIAGGLMKTCQSCLGLVVGFFATVLFAQEVPADSPFQAGFAEVDITPPLDPGKPVYMAGFGQNRKATGVHDPLMVRAVVLKQGRDKIALASADVVGLFRPLVLRVRQHLPGFSHVVVSSTHNHEGPDTLGLWGPNYFQSGIDPAYLNRVEDALVKSIRDADAAARPVTARLGTARAPELLHDGREPYVKHDELVALQFQQPGSDKNVGLIVQWNCHPETLGGGNTQLSADFVGATVEDLHRHYRCPVVYFTGTVGGLMTSLHVEVKDKAGKALADGTFEKTLRYGHLVSDLARQALSQAQPVRLTPLEARSREVFLPLHNRLYVAGWQLGVLKREAYVWKGDATKAEPLPPKSSTKQPLCIRSEIGWLRLGELEVALIPGEIYPELVLDKVQDPPDPGADFPQAAIEPAIYKHMRGPKRMLIGLANDELGYIIPKRQWDEKPPFCYGRKRAQYGEVNSVGPETAPILCQTFRELVGKKPD